MNFSMLKSRGLMTVGLMLTVALASFACAEEELPTATPVPLLPIVVEIGMTASTVMAPVNIDFEAEDFTDGVSYFWDFGDGNTSAGTIARHTYLDAGTFTVKLTASRGDETEISESTITVQPGDAGWLVLNAEDLTLAGAETFQFEVEAFDHLGNRVVDPDLMWYADPATGSIEQDGLYTAGTDIGSASEGVRVDFTRGNFTANYVIPVSVVHGPATTLAVTPEVVDTRVTWEVDMHAEVLDHVGHVLEDAEVTWEVLRPGDEIDQTGHYTPNETMSAENASLVLVTATAGDVTLERIIKGTVGPGILDRVEVDRSLLELKPGDEVQLTATGFDRFGHELELDEVMWEVDDPEIGSFSEDGVFTAGVKSGTFPENTVRVRGIKDGVQTFSDVPLSILPSQAVAIEFENEFDSVPAGSSSPVPLSVLDKNGNAINDVDVYLEVTAGGALNQNLAFKAGFEPGLYDDAVIARVLPEGSGNAEQIEATMDIEIRQRSSDFLAIDIVGPRGGVVYLINLVTGDLVPLSADIESNEFEEQTPSWWPDGSRVVYSSDVNGNADIFDTDPFTGDVRLLATSETDLVMPAISPDGTQIAFVELLEEEAHIYVGDLQLDENGNVVGAITLEDAEKLTTDDGLKHLFPYWSPDGTMIMYTSTPGDGRFRVTISGVGDIEGTTWGETLTQAHDVSGLAWHPDGERILVATREYIDDERRDGLVLGNLFTGEIEEIDVGGLQIGIAAISPDGSEISFVEEGEGALWLMDIDGTGRRQALGGQFQTTVTAWRPQPLELPTPVDRVLGTPGMVVPDGQIVLERLEGSNDESAGPYQVLIETDRGDVTIDLYNHLAPVTVDNFLNLAKAGYYNGLDFHTVEPGSAVFSGSKINAFGGTAGYYIPSEYHPDASHDVAGTISMVSKVVNGGSSEFVITLEPKTEWDAFMDGKQKDCADPVEVCYAVFGRVIEGLDVLMGFEEIDSLAQSDEPHRILKVTVLDGTAG